MGLLGDIFSAGDRAKRKLKGLLSDPMGELGLFGTRAAEDIQNMNQLAAMAYPMLPREQIRTDTPQGRERVVEQNRARNQLADLASNMGMAAATVWHGSPHKFDRFDSSKIGTGEGAQAYGHGLYLAESPGVADSYRKALSDNVFTVNGREILGPASKYGTTGQAPARAALSMPEKMASYAIDSAVKAGSTNPASDAISHLSRHGKGNPDANAALEIVRNWQAQGAKLEAGNLYKVDLPDEAIAKMLDWDKPISEQPQAVRDALAKLPKGWATRSGGQRQFIDPAMSRKTGGGLLEELQMLRRGQPEELLKQAGIPGIRYLDGGSRGAGTGTSNFVVFPGNEGLLTILERNGQPVNALRQLLEP